MSPTNSNTYSGFESYTDAQFDDRSPGFGGTPFAGAPDDIDLNLSSTEYAIKSRKFMELYTELRAMGAGNLIDLPSVAVIGNQSAGKSSLVEAISGINVPRDSGTCTKCPMECSMSRSTDPWSCRISLRWEYGPNASFRTVSFGPLLTEKREVDLWLRRAQAAILSPHVPVASLFGKTRQELQRDVLNDKKMLKFSKNVVVLDIKDPDATDLCFIDLPGLIQNEDPNIIDLVTDLVVSYITREKTLILITIPMNTEWQGQGAILLASDADPYGERTIGVLTKPDSITSGAISTRREWMNVLRGTEHRLKHGYYCVRLPDEDERSQAITRLESQKRASQFFDSTPPWNQLANRSLFGIPSVVRNVSKVLVERMQTTLPIIKQEVDRLLVECNRDLDELPLPLFKTAPEVEMLQRIMKFCDEFHGVVLGHGQDKGLAQGSRAHYADFKKGIMMTEPDYTLVSLSEIRDNIEKATGWELPYTVPYAVKPKLIQYTTSIWRDPTIACFNEVHFSLSEELLRLLNKHFGVFMELEQHMSTLANKVLDDCRTEAFKALNVALAMEQEREYTQNRDYAAEKSKWLDEYRDVHINEGQTRDDDSVEETASSGIRGGRGYQARLEEPSHTREEEIMVMAEVRAYFEIASKRFIDHVPMTIEYTLSRRLANDLREAFLRSRDELLNDHDKLKALLREDPVIATRREELQTKKNRLTEIKQKLDSFRSGWVV